MTLNDFIYPQGKTTADSIGEKHFTAEHFVPKFHISATKLGQRFILCNFTQ